MDGIGFVVRVGVRTTYRVLGTGDVFVTTEVNPDPTLPDLARIGLQMTVPGGFETITWYGRGPHESYVDRKCGVPIGKYSGAVADQLFPYVMPQESGNKADVRWATLTNDDSAGLLVAMVPGGVALNVNAMHFTDQDLLAAYHTNELTPRDDITFSVDAAQMGLGGASCGPGVLPQYRVKAQPLVFTVRMRGLVAGDDAATLARTAIG